MVTLKHWNMLYLTSYKLNGEVHWRGEYFEDMEPIVDGIEPIAADGIGAVDANLEPIAFGMI